MSAESERQFAALNVPEWLDHLRAQGNRIYQAFVGLQVEADELRFVIDDVPVRARWGAREVVVSAGRNDDGSPMYQWTAPLAWFIAPTRDADGA